MLLESSGLYQIINSLYGRSYNAALSWYPGTRRIHFPAPCLIRSARIVARPADCQFSRISGHVGYLSSLADLFIGDRITHGNFKHSPLHCPLGVFQSYDDAK